MPIGDFISGGLAGIGGSLGSAHGSITIDTSGLGRAAREARLHGGQIRQNLERTIGGGITSITTGIRQMRTEIAAIGAVGGLVTAFGVGAARDLRNYRIAVEQLLGSQAQAEQVIMDLTAGANEYGLELNNVLKLGRQLLPILEGNTDATEEWVTRAARLRSVFPTAQQGAELRALSEFLAGQTISLQRLFNIPPNLILEAQEQFEDAGRQIDFILDRMGATEEAARQMADPIVTVKNELRLIAAVGFTPILQDMRRLLPDFREWLTDLRQTHPEILRIGAAMATAAAVGAPLVILLERAVTAAKALRLLSLGKIGLVAVGGTIAAREGIRAIGRQREDPELANIRIRDMLFGAAGAIVDVAAILASTLGFVAAKITEGFGTILEAMGNFVQSISRFVPERAGGEGLRERGEDLAEFGRQLRETTQREDLPRFIDEVADARNRLRRDIGRFLGALPDPMEAAAIEERRRTPGRGTTVPTGAGGPAAFTEEEQARIAAWQEFQSDLLQIEREAQAQRLTETSQYEEQRTQLIASYNLSRLREEQDFNRRRRRENLALQDDIQAIIQQRQDNEAEWQEDLNKRIADIQEKAARDRQRMEEDHRETLLQAASRLDARAVATEQRRFSRQMTRFEEDLQERIDSEREAHRERVEQARQAEQERIENLKKSVAERQAIEDEERAIRLERQEEDHEAQLEQLDKQHQARLDQIDAQEKAELAERRRIFQNSWMPAQRAMQEQSLREFENYLQGWLRVQNKLLNESSFPGGGGTGPSPDGGDGDKPDTQELMQMAVSAMQEAGWSPSAIFNQTRVMRSWTDSAIANWIERNFPVDVPGYQFGTPFVPRDMLAFLHRGEAVIDAETAEFLRRGLGREFSPQQLAGSVAAGGSRSVTLVMERGAIQINESSRPGVTGQEVEAAMIRLLERT